MRGLRRDAVHQAADAAVRRPRAHRQRHRLLVDLRRQPADHAVHHEPRRARPGVGQLAVRGQRRVRPRACGSRVDSSRSRRRARWCRICGRQIGDGLVDELLGADQSSEAGIAAQRERVAALRGRRCLESSGPRLAASTRWPTTSCARASGSSAATAGRTTSAIGGLDHVLAQRTQRQHAGARHRGLLQHGRTAVQGDAARRGRQVRGGRQGDRRRRTSA